MNILLRFLNLLEQNAFFVYSPSIPEPGWRRNDLLHPVHRGTMQAVRGMKNAPPPLPVNTGKGLGAF